MGKNFFKILTVVAAITMTTTLTAVWLHRRKTGYIRPLKLTYSFIYE